jgi:hypothetical protein
VSDEYSHKIKGGKDTQGKSPKTIIVVHITLQIKCMEIEPYD